MAGPALRMRTSVSIPAGVFSRTKRLYAATIFAGSWFGHQPHADLGRRARRDHGFRARAGEPSRDAVHFKRRAAPTLSPAPSIPFRRSARSIRLRASGSPASLNGSVDQLCFSAGDGCFTSPYMPGIMMRPLWSFNFESSSINPNTAFGAAPPYKPECRSRAGPRASISV